MTSRANVVLVAGMVMLGSIALILTRGEKPTQAIDADLPVLTAVPMTAPAPTPAPTPAPMAVAIVAAPDAQAAVVPTPDAAAVSTPDAGDRTGYTAVKGDTLSDVAAGLLGSDSKRNRDAVIAGNPAVEANPDRVLAGTTYFLDAPGAATAPTATDVAPASAAASSMAKPQPDSDVAARPEAPEAAPADSDRVMRYTAQPGDNVSILAAGLLGEDSKANRDAIIDDNRSLRRNPDHVVAGKTYNIPTTDGLSAAPAPAAAPTPFTGTQPDADDAVKLGAGRELRYTARAGDTVSKLADVLLGSDTQANRDAIVNNNASLKADPDLVVAGQTYWIPAPDAPADKK